MLAHCRANGVLIGSYWANYVEIVATELASARDRTIFSPELSFAPAFGGGSNSLIPYEPGALSVAIDRLLVKAFSRKMPRAVSGSPLLYPLFRRLNRRRLVRDGAKIGLKKFRNEARLLYALLYDAIRTHGLETMKEESANDVEVKSPRGETCRFSHKTLISFVQFLIISGVADCKNKVVLEIGSGVGELARIFVATRTARKYILVDIPPALAFAERHLLNNFPADRIDRFDPGRRQVKLDDDRLFVVLTPDQMKYIERFDVGINIASFGEMDLRSVESYVAELKTKGFSDFVSINHRLGKPNNPSYFGEKEYVRLFAPGHEVAGKYGFDPLVPSLADDEPGLDDYQVLHFRRKPA